MTDNLAVQMTTDIMRPFVVEDISMRNMVRDKSIEMGYSEIDLYTQVLTIKDINPQDYLRVQHNIKQYVSVLDTEFWVIIGNQILFDTRGHLAPIMDQFSYDYNGATFTLDTWDQSLTRAWRAEYKDGREIGTYIDIDLTKWLSGKNIGTVFPSEILDEQWPL